MRLIGAFSIVFGLVTAFGVSGFAPATPAPQPAVQSGGAGATASIETGRRSSVSTPLATSSCGPTCCGCTRSLRRSLRRLPWPWASRSMSTPCRAEVIAALRAGQVDLTDPAVTVELLRLNAVVGVRGTVNNAGQLTSVGITCALCHSSVDNSFTTGIGKRLDGWANTDLNVGAIVALSPALDEATRAEFNTWGPGKYDPRHHAFDGKNIMSAEQPLGADCYSAHLWIEGRRLRDLHRPMGPSRIGIAMSAWAKWAAKAISAIPRIGLVIRQSPDLVTPKLPALLDYQLSLRTPQPPEDSFNREAANRGKRLFRNEAGCATCHQTPHFTDVLSGPDTDGALPARPGRGRHGSRVCGPNRHRTIPDDTATRLSGSMRRISTTAVRRISWRWSITTTGCSR